MEKEPLSTEKIFTYGDYRTWPPEERWELIDGVPRAMTAPSINHQDIVLKLGRQFDEQLEGKPCRPFIAPIDILLPKGDEVDDEVIQVVQPDLAIYCDDKKIRPKNCRGAPDLAVDILSVSTSSFDHLRKKAIYERAGVREYWLVHPDEGVITIYVREPSGKFGPSRVFSRDDSVETSILPGVVINFPKVYARIPNPQVVKEPPTRYFTADSDALD